MAEVAQRTSFVGTKIASGKTEFAARLSVIDPALAAAVKNGSVQVVDAEIYSARALESNTTIELMQSSDDKKVGFSNINKRQLEANTYFLVTAIRLVANNDISASSVDAADYTQISNATLKNGEFELKCGDKILIPRSSMEMFVKGTNADEPGTFVLDCPKLISPLTDIIPQIWLPAAVNSGKAAVKIVLVGVKTNKA